MPCDGFIDFRPITAVHCNITDVRESVIECTVLSFTNASGFVSELR